MQEGYAKRQTRKDGAFFQYTHLPACNRSWPYRSRRGFKAKPRLMLLVCQTCSPLEANFTGIFDQQTESFAGIRCWRSLGGGSGGKGDCFFTCSCPESEEKHLAVCAKLNFCFYLQDGSFRSSVSSGGDRSCWSV